MVNMAVGGYGRECWEWVEIFKFSKEDQKPGLPSVSSYRQFQMIEYQLNLLQKKEK
jgi:hypothetical protein